MIFNTPKKIGNLEIKNRLIRSATFEGMATKDGFVTDQHIELYKNLAKGGVGLIITGYSYIQESGKAMEHKLAVHKDECIPGLSKIANVIHENSNECKVALQIVHCGRQSRFLEETFAPSAVLEKLTRKMPRKMSIQEIEETIDAFAQAARRSKESGYDAVQLHGAHGYLINEFLSPYTNKRTDEYGGSLEKRMKFVEEIYKKCLELVGKDFPILIKMNGSDFLEGGLTIDESKVIAEKLSKLGFAAIEISGGMWEVAIRKKEDLGWKPTFLPESRLFVGSMNEPAYNLPFSKEIKKVIDIPLILVGGINSLDLVEKILKQGHADFLSFSRPLTREPDLPNRWIKGEGSNSVECVFCNGCLSTTISGGLRCAKKEQSKNK